MADLVNLENLFTLALLTLLQMVLGFDNLLYISIESRRVPRQSQAMVRRIGIGLAIVLRIVLLFAIIEAIDAFRAPFAKLHIPGVVEGEFTIHAILVLLGGGFIIYTALKEIHHMLSVEDLGAHGGGGRTVAGAILWIVAMNLVFSFDSILSALALTDVFWVMAVAIVISGVMMIVVAGQVSAFLQKNRMYEVLGLFVLLIVGVMLVSEGGHLAHLKFFGFPVEPMAKTTFYFVLAVLVIVEIVQSRYQKKIMAQKRAEIEAGGRAAA